MATQPSTNPVHDAVVEVLTSTLYADSGVDHSSVIESVEKLNNAGLLTDRILETDVATLHMHVRDDGDTWSTWTRYSNVSPQSLADMLAACVADVIQSAVESVGEHATAGAQERVALAMLSHVTRAVVPQTVGGLPADIRAAVMQHAAGDSDD